jgi:hypothetical protein
MSKVIAGIDLSAYYRYAGSLTAPPCVEGIIWNNVQQPIEISVAQVNAYSIIINLMLIYVHYHLFRWAKFMQLSKKKPSVIHKSSTAAMFTQVNFSTMPYQLKPTLPHLASHFCVWDLLIFYFSSNILSNFIFPLIFF